MTTNDDRPHCHGVFEAVTAAGPTVFGCTLPPLHNGRCRYEGRDTNGRQLTVPSTRMLHHDELDRMKAKAAAIEALKLERIEKINAAREAGEPPPVFDHYLDELDQRGF